MQLQIEFSGVHARQVEHVVHQVEQVSAADTDAIEIAAVSHVDLPLNLQLEQFGIPEDGIEGRSHLVRHHRDKAVPRPRCHGQLFKTDLELGAHDLEALVAQFHGDPLGIELSPDLEFFEDVLD